MKKTTTILLGLIIVAQGVYAQDENLEKNNEEQREEVKESKKYDRNHHEIKTIFSRNSQVTGFGSFDMKVTEFNHEESLFIGGHGGIIINKAFMLGLGGYGLTTENQFEINNPSTTNVDLYGGYGGIIVGFNFFPKEIIHLSFPILLGAGGIEVVEDDRVFFNENRASIESSAFFVAEPSAQLEINMTKFFRVGLGVSYRYVQGTDFEITEIEDSDLTNWTAGVSFKFGKF